MPVAETLCSLLLLLTLMTACIVRTIPILPAPVINAQTELLSTSQTDWIFFQNVEADTMLVMETAPVVFMLKESSSPPQLITEIWAVCLVQIPNAKPLPTAPLLEAPGKPGSPVLQ